MSEPHARKTWEIATEPTDTDVERVATWFRGPGKTSRNVHLLLTASLRDGRLYPAIGLIAVADLYQDKRSSTRCVNDAIREAWHHGLSRNRRVFQPTPLAERVAKALADEQQGCSRDV